MSFRYHLVSLVAVFLALTVGLVVGKAALSGPELDSLRGQVTTLTDQKSQLADSVRAQQRQTAAGDEFAAAMTPKLAAGVLKGDGVVLVATADADQGRVAELAKIVGQAGGKVTGTVVLAAGWSDPARATELSSYVTGDSLPAGFQLPATTDPGLLSSALLAHVLVGKAAQTDLDQVIAGLAGLKVLTASDDVAPADLALLVVGSQADPAKVRSATDLASALDRAGRGAVVAGAGTAGAVGAVRADQGLSAAVSTVDSAGTATGRLAVVYALAEQKAGKAGQYGASGFPTP